MSLGNALSDTPLLMTRTGSFRTDADGVLKTCLLYTTDAADDLLCVDPGGRRIIKKKKNTQYYGS